jgi:hypothetical protein
MKKVDRIINTIREMMTANPPGQSGGFTSSSPAEGPTAGFDSILKRRMTKRNKPDLRYISPKYRRWIAENLNT